MKLGDKVTWTSQSQAHRTTKRGTIVAVVPVKNNPLRFVPAGKRLTNPGMARDHVSYLVDAGMHALYWPRVSTLRFVGPPAYEGAIYEILRELQDGDYEATSGVGIGALTIPLSTAYDRIIAAVRAS